MKNRKIFNITLLSSLLLLSACSNKQDSLPEISAKKQTSIYNLMGITKQTNKPIQINNDTFTMIPQAIMSQKVTPQIIPTQDISYISYKPKELPPQDISYISYKQDSLPSSFFAQKRLELINKIELDAKKFLGVPYVWGATGPSKFDCSGFTQWVYRDSGINIPRVSRDQARVGEFVEYDNLQRGDMVFFNTTKKRTGKVTHVGIYLGNGDFIHASSAGKSVVIYNFNQKPYYKDRFLWGRRVLKPDLYYASN